MQVVKAILVAAVAVSIGFAAPVEAGGNGKYGAEPVQSPHAASILGAKSHYVEFIGREGSSFGHSFVRLGIVGPDGRNRRIMDLGLYPAGSSGGKTSALVGTRAVVGYTSRDLNNPPVVVLRHYISAELHHRLAGSVGRLSRLFPYFELLRVNCNSLTGYVARMLGLRAPHHVAQRGEDYVRELKVLNAGLAGH